MLRHLPVRKSLAVALLLIVWATLGVATSSSVLSFSTADDVVLEAPAIPQRMSEGVKTKLGTDKGEQNCAIASTAMVLRFLGAKAPAGDDDSDIDYYKFVVGEVRKHYPDYNRGVAFNEVAELTPQLTDGMVTATPVMWGQPWDTVVGKVKASETSSMQAAFKAHWQQFLQEELRSGHPVIVQINDTSKMHEWWEIERWVGGSVHAIVVVGIRGDQIVFNDPWTGKQHQMSADKFAVAWGTPQPGRSYTNWIALKFNGGVNPVITGTPEVSNNSNPMDTPSPKTTERIAYWDAPTRLVIQDLATGAINPISPPEPGAKHFAISADLSTYAWIPDSQPFRVMVMRQGQPAKALLTYEQLVKVGLDKGYAPPWDTFMDYDMSLSSKGALLAVGPLGVGASRIIGVLVQDTVQGTILTTCGINLVSFSQDEKFVAGSFKSAPGAEAAVVPGVCSTTASRADVSAAEALNSMSGSRFSVGNLVKHAGVSGSVSWDSRSQAILFAQTAIFLDAQAGQCISTDSIIMATIETTKTLYTQASVALGAPSGTANAASCPWQTLGIELSSPVLSPDGQKLAFEQHQLAGGANNSNSSIWIMNIDGSGLRQVADGSKPFWVLPESASSQATGSQEHPTPTQTGPSVSLNPASGSPGTTVEVMGRGWPYFISRPDPSGGYVNSFDLFWDVPAASLVRVRVEPSGEFRTSFTVPTNAGPGEHAVKLATVMAVAEAASVQFTVVGASPGSVPSNIAAGSWVQVSGAGDCLNFRANPSTQATIRSCQRDGFLGQVAEGPRQVDDRQWFLIKDYGWAVSEYLQPSAPPRLASSQLEAVAQLAQERGYISRREEFIGRCDRFRTPQDYGKVCTMFADERNQLEAYWLRRPGTDVNAWLFVQKAGDGWRGVASKPGAFDAWNGDKAKIPWP